MTTAAERAAWLSTITAVQAFPAGAADTTNHRLARLITQVDTLIAERWSDGALLRLYRLWSEDNYSASFISPHPETSQDFAKWLLRTDGEATEDYERTMLGQVRSALASLEKGEKP